MFENRQPSRFINLQKAKKYTEDEGYDIAGLHSWLFVVHCERSIWTTNSYTLRTFAVTIGFWRRHVDNFANIARMRSFYSDMSIKPLARHARADHVTRMVQR